MATESSPADLDGSLLVTAIYSLYEGGCAPSGSGFSALLERLAFLFTEWRGPGVVFCSAHHRAVVEALLPATAQVVARELEDTKVHEIYCLARDLPSQRCSTKDSKAYMTLMCAKPEMLSRARALRPSYERYVWVDAGIRKILPEEDAAARAVLAGAWARVDALGKERSGSILMPGCWPGRVRGDCGFFAERVFWRFCGGFVIVPADLVAAFEAATLAGCKRIVEATGKSTWEVNVWALVEGDLPVRWYRADHDPSIFDFPSP